MYKCTLYMNTYHDWNKGFLSHIYMHRSKQIIVVRVPMEPSTKFYF